MIFYCSQNKNTKIGSPILLAACFSIKSSLFVCQSSYVNTCFFIKFEHKKVCSLLFGSSTTSTIIGERLSIAVRTIKKGLPSFWLHPSQLKPHSLSVNYMYYYWRMIIYCSENNKIGSFIPLAASFPIKSSLFVCQSYVKLCLCGKNEHTQICSLLFGSNTASTIIRE